MNPRKSEEVLGNNKDDVYSDQNPFLHHHYHHHFGPHHHHRQILLHHDEDTHFQPSIDQSTSSPRFSPSTNELDDNNPSPNPSDEDADDSLRLPLLQIPPPSRRQQLPLRTFDPAVSCADSALNNEISTGNVSSANPTRRLGYVEPEPHISTQFYTFNGESHALMIRCLVEGRLATPAEIRAATPPEVLRSWRAVWRDRNEDTAYTTGWKRIQEKLQAHVDERGNRFLCFKSNSQQFVSHLNQWQDIVMSCHGDSDLKHFCLRETIERVKQVWTVGAKFYGIPESFIRVCVASCPVCSGNGDRGSNGAAGDGGGCGVGRPKRRRFEYTESFDVPAREVPNKLQQLAKKHKVVLCIRQKYIRHKPFMAEVKDYACHRAGEPASKKPSKALKREPYASKRCGCGFRIRAIVPITDYNEKDKSFVYLEEGMAVFKLYAVHTGHEPGPRDGNARIMHRVVGHKGVGFLMDQEEAEYGVNEVMGESDDVYSSLGGGADEGDDFRFNIVHQLQELKNQVGLLERKVGNMPHELVGPMSRELYDIVNKVRMLGDQLSSKAVVGDVGLLSNNNRKPPNSDMLLGEGDLTNWSEAQEEGLYGDGKEADLLDDDEDSFGRTLGEMAPWDQMGAATSSRKVRHCITSEICKTDKWLKFDGKDILDCEEDSDKLTKPISHDENVDHIEADDDDVGIVGIQANSFYPENPKLYDSPCGLDSSTDCGDNVYRNGEFV